MSGLHSSVIRPGVIYPVNAIGFDAFREQVETEWQHVRETGLQLDDARIEEVANAFRIHRYRKLANTTSIDVAENLQGRLERLDRLFGAG